MAFDLKQAREAGYSDAEIADYLGKEKKFDVGGARNSGYSDTELVDHLITIPTEPTFTEKVKTSFGNMADTVKSMGVSAAVGAAKRADDNRQFGNDAAIALTKSAIGVPETIVGVADLASGGRAGKAVEDAGVRFSDARQALDEAKSDRQKQADANFQNAEGFVDKTVAAVNNPSVVANAVIESAGQMGLGGVIGRGLTYLAPKLAPVIAGAVGEGVTGAASQAENTRQSTDDGLLTNKQVAAAGASGLGTAFFGVGGGKVAQKFGLGDVDTILAGGAVNKSNKTLARKMVEGGIAEGVFEELPQSVQEQMLSNWSLDKPIMEGVDQAAALGMLTGGAMGAGVQLAPQQQIAEQKAERLKSLPNENLQRLRSTAERAMPADVPLIDAEIERRANTSTLTRAAEEGARVQDKLIIGNEDTANADDAMAAQLQAEYDAQPSEAIPASDILGDENVSNAIAPTSVATEAAIPELDNAEGSGGDILEVPRSGDLYAGQPDDAATLERGNESNLDVRDEGGQPDVALDQDWQEFPAETKTLGIPRDEMPQIKAEHRGAMVNFLNARDISHEQDTVPASSLKPTQKEFSLSKVEQAKNFEGGNRSILVSSDNHILDGHHQWLSKLEQDEPIDVIRLNAPITELIGKIGEFPSATTEATTKPKNRVSKSTGTLLAKLKKTGGITLDDKLDVTGEGKGFAPGGYNSVFNKQSSQSLRGLIESGTLDDYLPENMRLSSMTQDSGAYDSTDAYDYLSERIRNGEKVLPYAHVQEIESNPLYQDDNVTSQSDIDEIAFELLEGEINEQLKIASNQEREAETEARIFEPRGETINVGSGSGTSATDDRGIGSELQPEAVIETPVADLPKQERESVKQHVETIVKRRAAANQIGKLKQFGSYLEMAKSFMNGENVSPNKFKSAATTFKHDQALASAFTELENLAKVPAKEVRAEKANAVDTYKQKVTEAVDSAALRAIAKQIQDDTTLSDAKAQELDDLVMDAIDALENSELNTVENEPEPAKEPVKTEAETASSKPKAKTSKPKKTNTHEALKEHFKTGNIIKSSYWGTFDQVENLNIRDDGLWEVTVHKVAKNDKGEWKQTEPSRVHSTYPDKRDQIVDNVKGDLLGDDTAAKQAIADAERAKDAKRNTGTSDADNFTLTGSNSEADKAAAHGAQGLFSQKPAVKDSDDLSDTMFSRTNQTQSEAFKKWFGNSKVVDENGNPLVVYHGTNADFEVFDYTKIGTQGRAEGAGFYFTNNKDVANGYGKPIETFLSIKKPMAYDAKPFGKPVLKKIIRRVAEIESERDGVSIGDGFLSNFGDVNYEGLDSVLNDATNLIADDETAVDQLSGIVGSGVQPEVVNLATKEVTGYDGIIAKGFGNQGDSSNTIYVSFFPNQIKSATNNNGNFDANDDRIAFNRGEVSSKGLPVREVQSIVNKLTSKWENGPQILVIESMQDPSVNQSTRDLDAQLKEQGSINDPIAFYSDGKVYILAPQVSNAADVQEAVFHEILGHHGLRKVFGKELANILNELAILRPRDIAKKAKQYGFDTKDKKQVRQAAEEVLAEMAQTNPQIGFVKRAIAAIRKFLRGIGINLKLTDNDIIANYILPARNYVIRSSKQDGSGNLSPAFSKQASFEQQVDNAINGEAKGALTLGKTPEALVSAGLPDIALKMTQKVVDKIYYDHGIPIRIIKSIPDLLANPMMVFKSDTTPDGFVVVTDAMKKGNPIVVTIKANGEIEKISPLNIVTSAYDKADEIITGWIEKGLLLGADKEKALAWTSTKGFKGVKFPSRSGNPTVSPSPDNGQGSSVLEKLNSAIRKSVEVTLRQNDDVVNPPPDDPAFSRTDNAGNQWEAPEESKMDNVIRALQNKHIDLKRVTENIQKAGKDIADRWNAYLQEELYHGRSAKRIEDFLKHDLEPLIDEMRERGVDMADFEEYLWMRHAEERNKQIAKVNPEMKDGGAGVKTEEAKAYLSGLSAQEKENYQSLAKRIDAMTHKSRQVLIDYGLESAGTIAKWEGAYKNYVPLMREDMDQAGKGTGTGFKVKGNASRRATGSNRAVVDIIANIAEQYERNIIRGEKNRVATALIGLATLNPNDGFWKVDTPPTITDVSKATGLVVTRTDPAYKNRPNVVVARIVNNKGEVVERSVTFEESDERAMSMAKAINNLDQDQLLFGLGMLSKFTRYFASINTQYNPIFGVKNIIRDTGGALLNLSTTPIAKHKKAVFANTPKAWWGIYSDVRTQRKEGRAKDTEWSKLFEEFQSEGGQTGFRNMFSNAQERSEALRNALNPTWWKDSKIGKIISVNGSIAAPEQWMYDKVIKPIFDWLSDYNTSLENAVRLSVYKVALDNGHTKQQAASMAKNISVNFNRKGQAATNIGALYAFFNASVQGSARIGETLLDRSNHGRLNLSSAGKKIVYGGMLLGAMQALLLAAAGFDEDEPPDFIKDRNLIIPDPTGSGKYVSIPMPLGYNALPAFGRIVTEWALSGGEDTPERIVHMLDMFLDVTNPIGNAGLTAQTITPTFADPIAALDANKDFSGKPIYREDFNSLNPTPGFTRSKDKAWDFSVAIARGINYMTGGNDYKQGAISPTADQLEYLAGQFTGGVGREIIKTGTTANALRTGEDLPLYKVPLVGTFVGDTQGQSSQGAKFYDNVRKLNEYQAQLKGIRKNGESTADFKADNPEARLYHQGDLALNQVSKLRKRQRILKERGADKEKISAIDERITTIMSNLNEKMENAKKQAK